MTYSLSELRENLQSSLALLWKKYFKIIHIYISFIINYISLCISGLGLSPEYINARSLTDLHPSSTLGSTEFPFSIDGK